MLIKTTKDKRYKHPKHGECGAVFSMAKDGRWYCVKRRSTVDDSVCAKCDKRDWHGCGECE